MPNTLTDTTTIAVEIDGARRVRRAIAAPARLAACGLPEAYDIQDALVASRVSAGAMCSGWKLALTSRTKRRLYGVGDPVFGRLFADDAVRNSGSVRFASFIAPRVWPVLAFCLSGPLDAHADPALLMAAIAWIAPALEISDSRYWPGRRSVVELVADNASSAAYVIGGEVRLDAAPRLDAVGTQIIRNGSVLASGTTASVLDDPFNALRQLARHLGERGQQAAAGDIVLSGAVTDGFPASPGDRFVARLRGLGTASVQFV